MGTFGGPYIVTDGLVFVADAGNTNCYIPGETTLTDLIGGVDMTFATGGVSYSPLGGGCWDFINNDYIAADNGDLFNFDGSTDAFSVAAWVRLSSLSGPDTVIGRMVGPGTQKGWNCYVHETSGVYAIKLWLDAETYASYISSKTYVDEWRFLCWTYEGGTGTIYEDGVFGDEATNYGARPTPVAATTMRFGLDDWSSEIKGKIAMVTIYDKVLSGTEVLHNYNSQKSRFGL